MDMRVKYSRILTYLLLLVAYFSHNSVLYVENKTLFNIVSIVICIMGLMYVQRSFSIEAVIVLVYLLLDIIFVRYISGGIGITIWLHWFIEIVAIMCAYAIDKINFFENYVKVIFIFSLLSLVGTFIWKINPELWCAKMPLHFNSSMQYSGFSFLYVSSNSIDHLGRNVGVFTEPGLYQIPLNTAVFFLLLFRQKIGISKKKWGLYLGTILLTVLSTKSTSAYVATIAIVFCAFLMTNIPMQQKMLCLASLMLILLVAEMVLKGENSIVRVYFIDKMFDANGLNLSVGNGKYRIRTIAYVKDVIKQYFWGAGYDNYNKYIEMKGGYLSELVGVECLKVFAYLGTPQMLTMYLGIFVMAFRNRRNVIQFLLVVFLYINATMAQTDIFYPGLVAMLFINLGEYRPVRGKSGKTLINMEKKNVFLYKKNTYKNMLHIQ